MFGTGKDGIPGMGREQEMVYARSNPLSLDSSHLFGLRPSPEVMQPFPEEKEKLPLPM